MASQTSSGSLAPAARFSTRGRAWPLLVLLPVTLVTGCPLLTTGGGGMLAPEMPVVELNRVALVEAPNEVQVASWGCHRALTGIPGRLLCDGVFGAAPSLASLRFSFQLHFDLTNTNDFPIPLVELLLGIKVFPERVSQDLGALCVTFCDPEEQGAVCDLQAAGGCSTDEFPEGGTAGLQIDPVAVVEELLELATGEGEGLDDNRWIRTLPAGGSTQVVVTFTLDALAMLRIIEQALYGDIDWSSLASGNAPKVDIPFSVEGILWFEVGDLGRVWVRFGPFGDQWDLLDGVR